MHWEAVTGVRQAEQLPDPSAFLHLEHPHHVAVPLILSPFGDD